MRFGHIATARKVTIACVALLIPLTGAVALRLPIPGDMELVRATVGLRNDSLTTAVWMLTFISSSAPALLLCVALGVAEWLRVRQREPRLSALLSASWPLVAYSGALACNVALRIAIGRMRPEVNYITHLLPEVQLDFQRFSYPSGHAGAALITYTSLAFVLWRFPPARRVAAVMAVLIIAGVGFGRIYLGVHWPSDVLAGYLLGAAWLAIARIACANGLSLVELLKHGLRLDT